MSIFDDPPMYNFDIISLKAHLNAIKHLRIKYIRLKI